ncbi:MAG TPA: hypothetical protein IAB38_02755 [Candidatus Onthousia excrementipullorum]|uniref:Uncharacterized protein n=1 Tax=Candidatus Onthousia excrementipullorum TaxID=2840884 RepID=A0A9D1DTW0_9FIRM|nr:hypothetical protein [Candidatus Onthousia excrementipullorum]
MTNTRDLLIRKYIIDIVFVVVVISLLTWFWFGPYQHKVRIRESLMANNIEFNKDIAYTGFDYIDISSNKVTKDLTVSNDSDKEISFIINFNNITNDKNNYINYILTDNEGYQTDIRNLSLDGYILENNLGNNETKTYTITMWTDDNEEINGNLNIILNPGCKKIL